MEAQMDGFDVDDGSPPWSAPPGGKKKEYMN
jgi:hypothetical protein